MNRTEKAESLKEARKLISKHQNWTKGVLARNYRGESVNENDPEACRFCILGALCKVGGCANIRELSSCLEDVLDGEVAVYNDDPKTTHKDIINLYNKAIKKLESKKE